MKNRYQKGDKLVCPKCQKTNDLHAEYCWACYFDFVPNEAVSLSAVTRGEAQVGVKKDSPITGFFANFIFFLVFAALSFGIVYGSWFLFRWLWPGKPIAIFIAGWVGLLLLTWFSEGQLPEIDTDWTEYWSFNPFNFRDDHNRFVLQWHLILAIPRIVLFTIRLPFKLSSGKL
jgi:hypothetical protein